MWVHLCSRAHLTFMFSQPFDMEITEPRWQYQRPSTLGCQPQTCNTETSLHKHACTPKHTLFLSRKGQLLFEPLWGLSPKPKCQHSLLTDSASSNNLVTVYILRPGDKQVTAVDLGHNRKSKGYEIYWGIGELRSETMYEHPAGTMPTPS